MATLTGSTIAGSYKDLLKIAESSKQAGLDGTLRAVEDGDATASALYLATDSALISGADTKLYFYDVGLAALLLGIHEVEQMSRDPLKGALFENLIVIDFLKNRFNESKLNDLYFFRDSKGNEVDLILNNKGKLVPIEIKSSSTFSTG